MQIYKPEPEESEDEEADLFDYDEKKMFRITIAKIVRNKKMSTKNRELTAPTEDEIGEYQAYWIPFGYRRLLAGFIREIDFMIEDQLKTHNCLFRAVYVQKVLDAFAEEIQTPNRRITPRWRSRVLNPILQRQLRGVNDMESESIKSQVGSTIDDATAFYLMLDPLHPDHIPAMVHNILYIWPVRLSLSTLQSRCSEQLYAGAIRNTQGLVTGLLATSDWEDGKLYPYEYQVIKKENLEVMYAKYIAAAVSNP